MHRFLRGAVLGAVICLPLPGSAADDAAARWRAEFAAFAREDAVQPARRGGVVFVGSSSIRLWNGLEGQFERFETVVKRGFGGSTLADCAENVDRLVLAYRPRVVVIYAGENDLAHGAGPADVLRSLQHFTDRIRDAAPAAHIAYVSIKPSPLRAELLPVIRDANDRIRRYLAMVPNAQFVDVYSGMLGEDGLPRAELFGADRLHMNAAGYALWRREISARLP